VRRGTRLWGGDRNYPRSDREPKRRYETTLNNFEQPYIWRVASRTKSSTVLTASPDCLSFVLFEHIFVNIFVYVCLQV